ncbi:hypothetical protein GCM10009529_03240 [Micropruina glycogenica]
MSTFHHMCCGEYQLIADQKARSRPAAVAGGGADLTDGRTGRANACDMSVGVSVGLAEELADAPTVTTCGAGDVDGVGGAHAVTNTVTRPEIEAPVRICMALSSPEIMGPASIAAANSARTADIAVLADHRQAVSGGEGGVAGPAPQAVRERTSGW